MERNERILRAGKAKLAEEIFAYLADHLDPALKKKISTSVLRELLSCVADWAYVERNKWLVGLSKKIERQATGVSDPPVSQEQELKDRLKPDKVTTTFLDALDEIR